jgi:hypothetical protein
MYKHGFADRAWPDWRALARTTSVLMLVLCAAIPACSRSRSIATGEEAEGVAVPCDDSIQELASLPSPWRVSLDELAVYHAEVNDLGRTGTDTDPKSARRFAKIALAVRSGSVVGIEVAPESQSIAQIKWGETTDGPVSHLHFGRCGQDRDGWLVYPGGVWVLRPACVKLIVSTSRESRLVSLSAGMACE